MNGFPIGQSDSTIAQIFPRRFSSFTPFKLRTFRALKGY